MTDLWTAIVWPSSPDLNCLGLFVFLEKKISHASHANLHSL
uniref:Uncharacterized protein n=1 Tax=Lepeophtheirus salmonis TaxID=72036 RepID=A0A0K2VAN2_LEPSM